MSILQIIVALWPILQKYGPELLAAEQALKNGGWAGLLAYLESLLVSPKAALSSTDHASLSVLVAAAKSLP